MNYTENLSLGLPEYGEDADVADLNRNSGILDAYCYNTRQIECEPYDSTKTYMSGDLSIHNEVVYECNTDNTTGTWDDSKWDSTTLAEQIAKAKQSGGESALADLEDVNLTNPSEGQILTYDDTNGEWVNTDNMAVTKEESGNPIELTDAASAPLVKCVTEIQGSQDLHGYDKPWVGGAGKNLTEDKISRKNLSSAGVIVTDSGYDVQIAKVTQGITYTFTTNDSAKVYAIYSSKPTSGSQAYDSTRHIGNNTFTSPIDGYVAFRTIADYAYAQCEEGNEATPYEPYSNICPITAYTENTISVGGDMGYDTSDFIPHSAGVTKTVESDGILFSANGSATYQDIAIGANNSLIVPPGTYTIEVDVVSVSDTSAESMFGLRKSNYSFIVPNIDSSSVGHKSLTVTTEESTYISMTLNGSPSSQNAIKIKNFKLINVEQQSTTTYPSAIYRGSEDVVNGEVTSEWRKISITNVTLYGNYGKDNAPLFYVDIDGGNIAPYSSTSSPIGNKPISNFYTPISASRDTNMEDFEFRTNYNQTTATKFYFRDSRFTTEADFNAYLANNPIEIAFMLATPTTSSVTPTNLPIKSLSGYNHIESSTGDMEVEYITSEYQPLVDLIQSSKHVYSTQEQIVGTWIDGSDLYEKTIEIGALPNNTTKTVAHGITSLNNIISVTGAANTSTYRITLPYVSVGSMVGVYFDSTNIVVTSQSNVSQYTDSYVTIRYTKATANRSLNAPVTSQKAQIEPLTTKEEEVPTEEEKAVNEEENTNENR